jgi:putative endonuclease
MRRKEAGAAAEDLALKHLEAAGLKLAVRNYRCRAGEIDLVMLDGREVLALIEVRQRSHSAFGGAAASVDYRKQQRLITAARHLWMMRADLRQRRARFDVVAIDGALSGAPRIEWLKDAFRL